MKSIEKQGLPLLGILSFALALRLMGVRWGVPTLLIPHDLFQGDEKFSMGILGKLSNFSHSHFNPSQGHREGPFGHWIWACLANILQWMGVVKALPSSGLDFWDASNRTLLLACRLVSVLMDVGSTALVYLVTFRITEKKNTALLAAFLFAIIPFEIIQSQWMRPHTMAMFFVLIALYYSTFLLRGSDQIRHLYLKIGIFCGIATATRYPAIVVFLFPLLLLPAAAKTEGLDHPLPWILKAVGKLWLCWLLGLFLADPYLFIDFHNARMGFFQQIPYTDTRQFQGLRGILDLSKTWGHLDWILPYGTFPALWVLFYGAVLYLLIKPKFRVWFVALLATLSCNLVLMTKGYLGTPQFVRTVIFSFPFFAIISALAVQEFFDAHAKRKAISIGAVTVLSVILLSTVIFDLSYVHAMDEGKDPRIQLYSYLSTELNGRTDVEVGLSNQSPYNDFIPETTLGILARNRVIDLKIEDFSSYLNGDAKPEYLVIAGLTGEQFAASRNTIAALEKAGRYHLVQVFENSPQILGWKFDYSNIPDDMRYVFPKVYLLKRA